MYAGNNFLSFFSVVRIFVVCGDLRGKINRFPNVSASHACMNTAIEDFIHVSNQANDADDLFQIFTRELTNLGLDRAIYTFLTDRPFFKIKAQHGVVRNYPEDWMKYYNEKNYKEHDPVYNTAIVSRRPFTWKGLVEKTAIKKKSKQVMDEAVEAGLKDGIAISFHGPLGEVVGLALASSTGDVDMSKNALSKIHVLSHQFHLCYNDFIAQDDCEKSTEVPPSLTPREKEILLWCAKNKSMSDIGTIIGISAKTVEFHLGNIYKKLGVNGKILAVLKAFHLGLISL